MQQASEHAAAPAWDQPRAARVEALAREERDLRDRAICRAAIRGGSRSFYAASLLLPKPLRDPAYALYAFCRLSDDAVDGAGEEAAAPGAQPPPCDRAAAEAALARLRRRLDQIYAGAPAAHPVDRRLAAVVAEVDMPRALFDALLEGFEWDVEGRGCADASALYAYAARVAGAVGAMMTALMGARGRDMAARACDLGVAMQLTNIARDVGEDARAGRVYLPETWLREEGLSAAALIAAPRFTPALGRVTARALAEADRFYLRAEPGIARLPLGCRPAIWAARRIYADIGRQVADNGFDSVSSRAVTSTRRKVALLARALGESAAPRPSARAPELAAPPIPETAFLVDAVGAARPAKPARRWRSLDDGIVRAIELLDQLERRDRARRAHGGGEMSRR